MRRIFLFLILLIPFAASATSADKNLQNFLQRIRKAEHIPGAVLLVDTPGYHKVFLSGYLTLNKSRKVNRNTLFGVGSITKTFVSAIILSLESEGRLKITDKVSKWLPRYKKWGGITIKQLLNMSSGIFNYLEDARYHTDLAEGFSKPWTSNLLINLAYTHKDYFLPGDGWHYSDTDYLILAKIIKKVTGKSLAENIKRKLLSPLKLKHSYYTSATFPRAVLARTAIGYLNGHSFNRNSAHNIGAPAAAMLMSANDLYRWVDDLFVKKDILPKKQYQEMIQGLNIPNNYENLTISGTKYGLGIPMTYSKKLGVIYWYTGITPWHTSVYVYIPSRKTTVVLETSFNRIGQHYRYRLFLQKPIMQKIISLVLKGGSV